MAIRNLFQVFGKVRDYFTTSSNYSQNPNEKNVLLSDMGQYLSDPHLSACVQSRKAGTLKLKFTVNDNGAPPEIVDFIKFAFEKLDTRKITAQMLDYFLYGYQPMELYYTNFDNKLILNDIKSKPPYWFKYDANESLRFVNRSFSNEIAPAYKVVVLRNNPTYINPYGESIIAKCYFSLQFKKLGVNYYAQYIENYGMPLTHITTSGDDAENIAIAEELALDLKANSVAVSNDAVKITTYESQIGTVDNFDKFIKYHNDEISKAILGQTLTTEEGTNGSYALGAVQNGVRQDIIDTDVSNCVAAWNEIIWNLVNINFGNTSRMPVVEMEADFEVDKTRAERDALLFADGATGFKPTLAYMVREHGFKPEDLMVAPVATPAPQFAETAGPAPEKKTVTTSLGKTYDLSHLEKNTQDIISEILQSIENQETYDEMETKLIDTFDGIDTSNVESYISQGIALATMAGYIDGAK